MAEDQVEGGLGLEDRGQLRERRVECLWGGERDCRGRESQTLGSDRNREGKERLVGCKAVESIVEFRGDWVRLLFLSSAVNCFLVMLRGRESR
jgi:hypothetical protein